MTLVMVLMAWTIAVYGAFALVYGDEVFDTDWGVDEGGGGGFLGGILDFFSDVGDFIGDLGQFITLGAVGDKVGPGVGGVFLISLGLGWLLILIGIGRGAQVG